MAKTRDTAKGLSDAVLALRAALGDDGTLTPEEATEQGYVAPEVAYPDRAINAARLKCAAGYPDRLDRASVKPFAGRSRHWYRPKR